MKGVIRICSVCHQIIDEKKTLTQLEAYAESYSYAGYDDWRLPNVKELQSLVDYSGVFPAIDPMFMITGITNEAGNADYPYFWTGTPAGSTAVSDYYYAYYVAFGYTVDPYGYDIHGADAVRFDTKVEGGPAAEDEERVYNCVRLVRDANLEQTGLLDTGQAACYTDNGDEISCPESGQAFEERNQLPGDGAPLGIFTLDSQGGITGITRKMLEMLPWPSNALIFTI
jgi:hypothetical protein